jgi:hypothetical protein
MADDEDLAGLSSRELHNRAVKKALRHGDVAFLWRLLEQIPAAEETAGNRGEGEGDLVNLGALLDDYLHAGEGKLADALRGTYLEYLREG